jgi:hypothetical protein
MFLGTPHQGCELANIAEIAHRIGEAALPGIYKPNRAVLQSLKRDCNPMFETASRFGSICREVRIFSYYEIAGRVVSGVA